MSFEPGATSDNPYFDALLRLQDRKAALFGNDSMQLAGELGDGNATVYDNEAARKLLVGLDLDVAQLDEFGCVIIEQVIEGLLALGVRFTSEEQLFQAGLLFKVTAVDPFTAGVLYERARAGS